METGAIRQLLKNLCTNSQWCYAVFWRLQQQEHHKILTCEEVYCDSENSQKPYLNIFSDHPYTREDAVTSFGLGKNVYDAHFRGYSIAAAVTDMSCCQYLLGEGMVGRVAVVENDFWIYPDDIEYNELISSLECGDEWFLPITTGIKTTLLASVSPYGVLQLGSFDKVVENLVLCADIRNRFYNLSNTAISPSSNYDDDTLYSTMMPESENTDEPCSSYNSLQGTMQYDDDTNIIRTPEFIQNSDIPTVYDQLVPLMDNGNGLDMEDLSFFIDDQQFYYPNMNFDMANVESDTVPNEFTVNDNVLEETEMWIDELQQVLGPDFLRECDELQQQAFESVVFPKDCELQEASIKMNNICFDSLDMEMSSAPFDEVCEQAMLLEALISTSTTENSLTEHATKDTTISASQGEGNTAVLAYKSTFDQCLASPPSLESLESANFEDQQLLNCTFEKNPKTEGLLSKPVKEKPKNKNRPRPRDRQLIQDRLKELRNLVPDSEKCSIDALLDQTMKHMNFLKSVTERAAKVKDFMDEKGT